MAENTTYSFSDIAFTISHDLVGQKQVVGSGIGKINIAYTDPFTDSELGADGSVMIDKINTSRATIGLQILQTSSLNKWLLNYANTVRNAAASYWAAGTITIHEGFDNGVNITAVDVALVKRPDRGDGPKGDYVTWEFFTAHMTEY